MVKIMVNGMLELRFSNLFKYKQSIQLLEEQHKKDIEKAKKLNKKVRSDGQKIYSMKNKLLEMI